MDIGIHHSALDMDQTVRACASSTPYHDSDGTEEDQACTSQPSPVTFPTGNIGTPLSGPVATGPPTGHYRRCDRWRNIVPTTLDLTVLVNSTDVPLMRVR